MSFGIDPVHFGIVVIFNLMIGLITPPMGICLFVSTPFPRSGLLRYLSKLFPPFLPKSWCCSSLLSYQSVFLPTEVIRLLEKTMFVFDVAATDFYRGQ
ncbi:TRAP transporter large permease subunit [Vibrio chagasii]|nr:TRAP transporter large permease subunit [Vibrio chagasii]